MNNPLESVRLDRRTWVALIAAGVVVGVAVQWYRSRRPQIATEAATGDVADVAATLDGYSSPSSWVDPLNPTAIVGSTMPTPAATWLIGAGDPDVGYASPAPATLEEWATAALRELTMLGYPPTQVGVAVRRYIDGDGLSAAERLWIDEAIRRIGAPPTPPPVQAVGDPPVVPPTNPPPTPAPTGPTRTDHVIRPGDTLFGLVRDKYGLSGSALIAKINEVAALNGLAWNAAHTVVSPWQVGQAIKL